MASSKPPDNATRAALGSLTQQKVMPGPRALGGMAVPKEQESKLPQQTSSASSAKDSSSTGNDGKNVDANARQARRKLVDRRSGDEHPDYDGAERRSEANRRQKAADKSKEKDKETLTREEMKVQQHRKKILLAGCEPVMGLNYDTLAMDDYPSNELVARARKDRDQWVAICALFSSVFLFGFTGFVPAMVAGTSCGLAVLAFTAAFTPLRTRFFDTPSLAELLQTRKEIEFRALSHIRFLEGGHGLAWRCEKMGKYNSNLNRKLFNGLIIFSKNRNLLDVIRNRKQIRLYLLFMIEAQKAYKRLQRDYLEKHFKHLDQGWDDSLSEAEARKIEAEEEARD